MKFFRSLNINLLFFLILSGCASPEHRREALQNEFPDCFVTKNLEILCEIPQFHH